MIERPGAQARIKVALRRAPVTLLLGPRQCGKSTLARQFLDPRSPNYFDLEDPVSIERLGEPMTALSGLRGLVVIDEIQRRPDLFPLLRVLVDRPRPAPRFLVLGSAGAALLRQSSESLAGRIETVPLAGFDPTEVGTSTSDRLWLRGGFPRSYLARSESDSIAWRTQFIQTFLERDVPQVAGRTPTSAVGRFWSMLAHYQGNVWSAADPARSLGVSEPTVRRYLDLLTDLLLVRQLPPWQENLAKRQVRSPKVYVRDSGILHSLLGIKDQRDLLTHPKCGGSWEGFVIESVLSIVDPDASYFWSTHQGAELDLLLIVGSKRIGIEIKRADVPRVSRSMHIALEDLHLDHLAVIYPGTRQYPLGPKMTAVPFEQAVSSPRALLGGIRRGVRRTQAPR